MTTARIYLDNAATTRVDPVVFEAMKPYFMEHYGNPSSVHGHGREARSAVEMTRKNIAELINATPGEIFFTSGGTEADNTIINGAIRGVGITHAITSKIEHHAVLHTLEHLEKQGKITLSFVALDEKGRVKLDNLEELLEEHPKSFVSLMHANNEVGNLLDIKQVAALCDSHGAFFHTDSVQTMGQHRHDVRDSGVHTLVCSAHKLHGPKGIGFMYIRRDKRFQPMIIGGGQEREMRGGTENVAGIVGLGKAMEIAYETMEESQKHKRSLKQQMMTALKESLPGISFNGNCGDLENSLHSVLNVSFPPSPENEFLLFNLDLQGISASGGSACASGASTGSHVLTALGVDPNRGAVRFSFGRYNTEEDIQNTVRVLKEIFVG